MKAVVSCEGEIRLSDIPEPPLEAGHVRIDTEYSAISPGTELMMNGQGRTTPIVLGYSAVGVIGKRGQGMEDWAVGQRVACYGAPYVRHAQRLLVPRHLMVPVPAAVSAVEASTVGLGAIAIHALRQADLHFGETLVVIGAGILGQLIAQIARAAGCRVIVSDVLQGRLRIAERTGIARTADSPAAVQQHLDEATGPMGADAVIVCTGKTDGLIDQALRWVRDRGKVLLVGDVEPSFSRELMFAKEATVLTSRAGGPGRYDARYEREGVDYPYAYVRWTEGRNMAEYIRLIAEGAISVGPLISGVYPMEQCSDVFARYARSPAELLGAVLAYPAARDEAAALSPGRAMDGEERDGRMAEARSSQASAAREPGG
ncbi:zinc-binding alcohol dehydrogenase [Paenibacillus sp. IB182496]|uniref:Zinc-binding alcohol dehydrogenase n=1 Tax=Paenibacillus sabuli TaxID=2772509 RepID=A0A927GPP5_9BACL|nr:zinc-binding alcohol dehydrogenase [Paenibacillus sabuli]MBD2843689.1 zinc-binding alcohol dehydrogenase [Paenibacillus sabuli]